MPFVQRAANWSFLYVLRPLLQILAFIVGSAVVMSILAVLVAILFPHPRPGIDLFVIVKKQLPYMLLDGMTIGFVYAMIALGYTMVYGVLKFINFAHSEIFMVGGVVGYEIMKILSDAKALASFPPVLLVILMVVAGMLISGLLAVIIERVAYKPLRNAPRLVPLISAIGVSFFLQDFVRGLEAMGRNEFNLAYPTSEVKFLSQNFSVPIPILDVTLSININSIIVVIGAILMVVGLNYFVNATKMGKGIRAVSQDQATASLMGINVNMIISLTFAIGGGLGGAAGVLFGLKTTNITPYIGFIPGIKAFTAAVLGGIGNITGALLGGILLGMLESFFAALLPYFPALGTGYRDIFAFAVLILILIFRPTGLLGQQADEKV